MAVFTTQNTQDTKGLLVLFASFVVNAFLSAASGYAASLRSTARAKKAAPSGRAWSLKS
jgi:hypothetical protein